MRWNWPGTSRDCTRCGFVACSRRSTVRITRSTRARRTSKWPAGAVPDRLRLGSRLPRSRLRLSGFTTRHHELVQEGVQTVLNLRSVAFAGDRFWSQLNELRSRNRVQQPLAEREAM